MKKKIIKILVPILVGIILLLTTFLIPYYFVELLKILGFGPINSIFRQWIMGIFFLLVIGLIILFLNSVIIGVYNLIKYISDFIIDKLGL